MLVRARVQTSRAQGSKMVFLNLRQRTDSVQALLSVAPEKVSKQMAKWAAGLAIESIVLAEGVVRKAPELIKSATVGDVELHLTQVGDTCFLCVVEGRLTDCWTSFTLSRVWKPFCHLQSTMRTAQNRQKRKERTSSSSVCSLIPD